MNNSSFNFIKFSKNSKLPINKWTDKNNQSKELPNIFKYNVGIPTGDVNNIIVLDIDVKDDGLTEWQTYITEHEEPLTLTVKTPSGGYHYYFKNSSDNELIKYLTTRTKYRGVGIDIRNNGGYVLAPPSIINNVVYEVVNETPLIEVPTSLLTWLLTGITKDVKKVITKQNPKTTTDTYIHDITDEETMNILNLLPKKKMIIQIGC